MFVFYQNHFREGRLYSVLGYFLRTLYLLTCSQMKLAISGITVGMNNFHTLKKRNAGLPSYLTMQNQYLVSNFCEHTLDFGNLIPSKTK